MGTITRNVTGGGSFGVVTQILAPGDNRGRPLQSIYFANSRSAIDSSSVIDIFIQNIGDSGKATEPYYLLRHVVIPSGAGLLLDDPTMLLYDYSKFSLFVQCQGSSDEVDVIINY